MGPLFLVNWHIVNIRFRALMWCAAALLALAILFSSLPSHAPAHRPPRAWPVGGVSLGSASLGSASLEDKP